MYIPFDEKFYLISYLDDISSDKSVKDTFCLLRYNYIKFFTKLSVAKSTAISYISKVDRGHDNTWLHTEYSKLIL